MSESTIEICAYAVERAGEIADLYYRSVHAIDSSVYTTEQKNAWAPKPVDYERWSVRLDEKKPSMAMVDDRVVGFMELDPDGHIDCAYTHPDFQGIGVASALYDHLLDEAEARNIERLYVEASHLARPFFEHRGFSVLHTNYIDRSGVTLVKFTMELHLVPEMDLQPDN